MSDLVQQLFFLHHILPDRLSGPTRATPSPCRPRGMNEVLHDGVYTPHHRLFFRPHQLECVGPRPSLPSRRVDRQATLSRSPRLAMLSTQIGVVRIPVCSLLSSPPRLRLPCSIPLALIRDGRTSIGAAGRTERVPVEEATPKTAPTDNRAEGQHSASGGDRANDPHAWSILLLFDLEITSQWTRCQIDYSTCVST